MRAGELSRGKPEGTRQGGWGCGEREGGGRGKTREKEAGGWAWGGLIGCF